MKLSDFVHWIKKVETQLTIIYSFCFFSLGLFIASIGPALLAFSRNTHGTLKEMSYTLAARSLAYLLSSAGGGLIIDKYPTNRMLSAGIFYTAGATVLLPAITNVALLIFVAASTGLSMGIVDIGGNVGCVRLWGKNVGPYMQFLHFSFGLGALASPALIGNFIGSNHGDPSWAFYLIGIFATPLGVVLLFYESPEKKESELQAPSLVLRQKIVVVIISCFLGVYVGAEVTAGGYITSYCVQENILGEADGAFLTSLFWTALTFGRLLSVPVSVYVSASKILIGNVIGCVLSTMFLLIFAKSAASLYVGMIMYGLSMSSTYGSMMNLVDQFGKLTGKVASVLVIGGSFGEMAIPLVTAYLISKSAIYFLQILLASAVISTALICVILFIGRGIKKKEDMVYTESANDVILNDPIDLEHSSSGNFSD